jgi:HNH endonuclease
MDRVMDKVSSEPNSGCWLWTGATTVHGYGHVNIGVGRGHIRAHRATYEALVGPIPEGMELDHLCRNPACCNPKHLEPVTHAENVNRGRAGALHPMRFRTHCKFGHPMTSENVYRYPKSRAVECRICRLKYVHDFRAKERA